MPTTVLIRDEILLLDNNSASQFHQPDPIDWSTTIQDLKCSRLPPVTCQGHRGGPRWNKFRWNLKPSTKDNLPILVILKSDLAAMNIDPSCTTSTDVNLQWMLLSRVLTLQLNLKLKSQLNLSECFQRKGMGHFYTLKCKITFS